MSQNSPKSPLHAKSWRLFITPRSSMAACPLSDEALLYALKEKFSLEDADATLTLAPEKTRYCATISLYYSRPPFKNHIAFDLEIITDKDQKIIIE